MKQLITVFALLSTFSAQAKIWKAMDDLNKVYAQESMGATPETVQAIGLKEYVEFVALEVNTYGLAPNYNMDSKKPVILSLEKASMVISAVKANPVVSLHQYEKYDPNNAGIGFCFGRAMFTDLYLTYNGLNRASIKKAFVVGPMTSGGNTKWGWHVSTIVQSKDKFNREVWLAIDPIMGRVMDVRDWYKECLKMSTDKKLRLYITDAEKFAQTATRYDEVGISNKFYNKYFTDMIQWFHENDVTGELKL